MNRLALDTSSISCSVALQCGDKVISRHEEQEREHTRLLMPMIRSVLDEAELTIGQLDAIVLGNGPGSFIGMRIAASVAQGLAHGAGIGVVPVSSLAAVAARVMDTSSARNVVVAQDAHMSEVYLGVFKKGDDDLPRSLAPERLQEQGVIPELAANKQWHAAGFGWQRYPELRVLNDASIADVSDICYPDARDLLRLSAAATSIPPRDVQPAYLRQKVAEKPGGSRQ